MKKFLFAVIASLTLAAGPALADTTLGVVNIDRVLTTSKASTAVRSQVQAKQKSLQAEFDAKKKELDADQQALIKLKDTADKDTFSKKVKEFNDKYTAANRQVKEKSDQLEKAIAGAQNEIITNASGIVKDIATERKITLVVASMQVVYGDPSLDLTDEVIKRLDAKLPNVTLKF